MSRLFIGPREQQFISDITKEYVKDVVGQYIVYFPVSIIHTKVHELYEEAIEKVYENPIKLDVLASQTTRTQKFNQFSLDSEGEMEIFVQPKDLVDKNIEMFAGDYFMYGDELFEVMTINTLENIYGQAEYERGVKLTAKLARAGEFDLIDFKNLLNNSKSFQESMVQKRFVQQRGFSENEEGFTADRREMRDRLGDDMADIALGEGPRKVDVTPEENEAIPPKGSNFYHE